jgi:hypothetical protein
MRAAAALFGSSELNARFLTVQKLTLEQSRLLKGILAGPPRPASDSGSWHGPLILREQSKHHWSELGVFGALVFCLIASFSLALL